MIKKRSEQKTEKQQRSQNAENLGIARREKRTKRKSVHLFRSMSLSSSSSILAHSDEDKRLVVENVFGLPALQAGQEATLFLLLLWRCGS